jgi:hypothetical protein
MSKDAPQILYDIRDVDIDNFVDLLTYIIENTKLKKNNIEILIELDYFSEYGDINYLLEVYNKHKELYKKTYVEKTKIKRIEEIKVEGGRRAFVRDVHHVGTGHHLEQFPRHMRDSSVSRRGHADAAQQGMSGSVRPNRFPGIPLVDAGIHDRRTFDIRDLHIHNPLGFHREVALLGGGWIGLDHFDLPGVAFGLGRDIQLTCGKAGQAVVTVRIGFDFGLGQVIKRIFHLVGVAGVDHTDRGPVNGSVAGLSKELPLNDAPRREFQVDGTHASALGHLDGLGGATPQIGTHLAQQGFDNDRTAGEASDLIAAIRATQHDGWRAAPGELVKEQDPGAGCGLLRACQTNRAEDLAGALDFEHNR